MFITVTDMRTLFKSTGNISPEANYI